VLRRLSGLAIRRVAPRSMAALEEVARLRHEVDDLRRRQAVLEDLAQGTLDELRTFAAEFGGDLQESRALSLRVGQLTDLVFSRLADAPTTHV
jgi:hypothetical protein